MSETDNFSHRAGYHSDPLAVAIKQARKGGTLAAGEGALLVAEIDRLERILAALREPSEAVVEAAVERYLPKTTTMSLTETREHRPEIAKRVWCGVDAAIRAAVAAAEKEVGNGEHHPNTLADLLREAADEIEGSVRHEYGWPDVHPARKLKFDRDMDIVTRLRSAAAEQEVGA